MLSQDKSISQNVEYTPPVYFDYFLKEGESIVHTLCMCVRVSPIFYTHIIICTTGDNLVGRGEDCDVTLSNGSLSRKHAQILVEKGSHFIKDLGSRNKTFRRKVVLQIIHTCTCM